MKHKHRHGFLTSEGITHTSLIVVIGYTLVDLISSGVITPAHIIDTAKLTAGQVQQIADLIRQAPDPVSAVCVAITKLGEAIALLITGYQLIIKYTASRTDLKKTSTGD